MRFFGCYRDEMADAVIEAIVLNGKSKAWLLST